MTSMSIFFPDQYQRILAEVIYQTCGEQYVPGRSSWTAVPKAAYPTPTDGFYVAPGYVDVDILSQPDGSSVPRS